MDADDDDAPNLTAVTPLLVFAAIFAALVAAAGQRITLGPRRRILVTLLVAVLAVPRWRRALMRALDDRQRPLLK